MSGTRHRWNEQHIRWWRLAALVLTTALSHHARAAGAPGAPGHYQCFELRRRAFPSTTVTLVDAFGSATAALDRPQRLCAPADVNGRDPSAPADPGYLTGYDIAHDFQPVLRQQVVNEFGSVLLDVVEPNRLLVPTVRGTGPAPAVPDHFQCYRVRRPKSSPAFQDFANVQVTDPFGTLTVELRRPVRLCVPADKNGESPGAEAHAESLLCYQTRSVTPFGDAIAQLSNQFGLQTVLLIRRQELCVPSTFTSTSGTSTTTIVTTTTTTSASTTVTSTTRPAGTTTSTSMQPAPTTSTTTPGGTTTSTSVPPGTTTSTTTPAVTTTSTSTTTPGATTTSTTTPAVTTTSTTVQPGTTTSTTTPGATTSTTSSTATTTSSTSTTLVTCVTVADCPQPDPCVTPVCADGVCTFSPVVNCPLCVPGPEVCGDGIDNDCDGIVDCHDPDCAGAPGCGAQEVCGDCLDNDGDGLVDFEDPDCCAQTLTLDLQFLRLRATPARHSHDRVNLRTIYAPRAPDGFDPRKQDTSVQIRNPLTELFCTTIGASHWMPRGRRSVSFWDTAGTFAGGLSDGRFTVRRSQQVAFRTHGPAPRLLETGGGPVQVVVRVGSQCSRMTGTLRGQGSALVVRRHGG